MEVQFDRPAEALAGLVWVVCAADNVGTAEEHNFIHGEARHMSLFADMSQTEFTSLLAVTRTKLFNALPNDGYCLSDLGAEAVITAANQVLNDDQKQTAYEMAVGLAKSDKLVGVEKDVLRKLKETFQI